MRYAPSSAVSSLNIKRYFRNPEALRSVDSSTCALASEVLIAWIDLHSRRKRIPAHASRVWTRLRSSLVRKG